MIRHNIINILKGYPLELKIESIKEMDKTVLSYTKGYLEGIMSVRSLSDQEKLYYQYLMRTFNQLFLNEIDDVYREMFE